MLKNLILLCTLIFSLSLQIHAKDQVQGVQAARSLDDFHQLLVEVMKAANGSEREQLLRPKVVDFFDVPRISRISLGRTWKKLTIEQQLSFVEGLSELIAVTYADRFRSYDGQRFSIDESEIVKKGVIIKTTIFKGDSELAKLHYYFRDGRVFNVVANGISDLSLRRAEYGSVIKEQGFDALLEQLRIKISETRASY